MSECINKEELCNSGGEPVVMTYNKKAKCFIIKGKKKDVQEIIKIIKQSSADVHISYEGWCG